MSSQTARHTLRQLRAWAESLATKCENAARRAPLRFSLLVTAGLMAIVFASLAPSFQSNDDPQMAMIAAGKGACLAPDEHLIFTNVVIGQTLKSLYTVCPSIPWYAGYLYLVQYLAQVAILYCTLAAGYSRLRLGMYLLFFATVGVFLLNNLQFTTTASLAAQSGALVCLLALRRLTAVPADRVGTLLGSGVALLLLSSLIRLECFYLTSLVVLPATVCLVGWPPRRAVLLPAGVTGGVCLALVLGLAAYNDAYYQRDPAWAQFLSYNKLRVKFNDYEWTSYTPQTAQVFDQVNWSANDHAMIAHWFYDDPVLYSEARLQRVLDGSPWRARRLTAAYGWSCVRTILRDRSLWPTTLILPLFLCCVARSRRNMLAFLASAAAAAILLGCIAVFNKLPPARVYYPVLTFPLTVLLLMVRQRVTLPHRRMPALAVRCFLTPYSWRRPGACWLLRPTLIHFFMLMTVLGIVYGTSSQYRHGQRMKAVRRDLQRSFAALEPRDDHLYVCWAAGFPYEGISPFDNLESFSELHQLVLGWPQRTPIFQAMKQKFGIADVSRALYERPDVFFVGNPSFHPLFRTYVQEHHGVEVRFAVQYVGGHVYDVAGRFEPSVAAGAAARRSLAPR